MCHTMYVLLMLMLIAKSSNFKINVKLKLNDTNSFTSSMHFLIQYSFDLTASIDIHNGCTSPSLFSNTTLQDWKSQTSILPSSNVQSDRTLPNHATQMHHKKTLPTATTMMTNYMPIDHLSTLIFI